MSRTKKYQVVVLIAVLSSVTVVSESLRASEPYPLPRCISSDAIIPDSFLIVAPPLLAASADLKTRGDILTKPAAKVANVVTKPYFAPYVFGVQVRVLF